MYQLTNGFWVVNIFAPTHGHDTQGRQVRTYVQTGLCCMARLKQTMQVLGYARLYVIQGCWQLQEIIAN